MRSLFQLEVKSTEGALGRVLGVLRRRGFEVVRLVVNRPDVDAGFDVAMMVESDRSADVLARWLAKLFDVEKVLLSDGLRSLQISAQPNRMAASFGASVPDEGDQPERVSEWEPTVVPEDAWTSAPMARGDA